MVCYGKKKNTNAENQILNAAKNVFQSKGMDGARMQEIADKAGINKAMLHYYYRSKQLLFEAVFKNAFALLAPQLNKVLNDDSSIEDKIRSFTSLPLISPITGQSVGVLNIHRDKVGIISQKSPSQHFLPLMVPFLNLIIDLIQIMDKNQKSLEKNTAKTGT